MVYPYRETPYASIFKDHVKFVLRCLGIKTNFAFHKNMMECYAKKPTANVINRIHKGPVSTIFI